MKKRRKSNTEGNNLIDIPNNSVSMVNDYALYELFDNIFRQLDDLKQRCENIEVRLNRIEQDVEFSINSVSGKMRWYEV